MYNFYIIEDDAIKLDSFPKLIAKVNESEIIQCKNGFGEQAFRSAFQVFETIDEKIGDPEGYWLLDLSLYGDNYEDTTLRFLEKYIFPYPELKEVLNRLLDSVRNRRPITLSVAMAVYFRQKDIPFSIISTADLPFQLVTQLDQEFHNIPYPENSINQDVQLTQAAIEIGRFLTRREKNPVQVFCDYMQTLTPQDCHIGDKILHNPERKDQYLVPIRRLSELLKYNYEEFLVDFDLIKWEKKGGADFSIFENPYNYPNAIEECLKCFAGKAFKRLSLMGVVIIAWAAVRSVRNQPSSGRIDIRFKDLLKLINHEYRIAEQSNNLEETEKWKKIIRSETVIANQSAEFYSKTLIALYDMIKKLSQDELYNNEFTIQKIELTSRRFILFFKMDADGLITTVNKVHNRIIEAIEGKGYKVEHVTSSKILKWMLYSRMSTKEAIDNKEESLFNSKHWGLSASFWIESEIQNGVKLLKLNFKI